MRPLLCSALVFVLVTAAAAQESQPLRFRTGTRLVQVSVVVQDKRGQPVPGLTAADFQLTEDRKVQPIAHFAVQQNAATAATANATSPSAAFTNVLDGRVGTGATIILFDRLNSSMMDQQQGMTHILNFLSQLQPTDRVGLYVLEEDGFRIIHDFAKDVAPLLTRLRELRPQASHAKQLEQQKAIISAEVTGLAGGPMAFATLSGAAAIRAHGTRIRSEKTVETLESIAQRLAGVQGRKNVVWVSSGFPLSFPDGVMNRNMSPEIYRATRALSQSDVAIYPVDARGLIAGTAVKMSTLAPTFDTASIIAEQTGGRAYRNTNDLATAIRTATEDARLTYVLGYYPTNEHWDRRFRRIGVKVARKNVTVRHRSGYYGHVPVTANADDVKQGLFEALARPLEATAIGITIDVEPGDGPNRYALQLRIDPRGVSLERKGDRWTGGIEIVVAHRGTTNKLVAQLNVTVPLQFEESTRQQFLEEGIRVSRTVTVPADATELLIGVRDPATGAVGTVSIDAARLRTEKR